MFVKILYGEVENNAWYGIDLTFKEIESIEDGRRLITEIISLDHDYPDEWLVVDVQNSNVCIKALDVDEGEVKIKSISAENSDTYSVYKYSIVSENK